ncbi:hypothetical protein Tco_0123704 [Tanacetum coccineum]
MPPRRGTTTRTSLANAIATTPMTDAAIRPLIAKAWLMLWLNKKFKETLTSMAMEAKVLEVFERMETVFHISNCVVENQVKFATCTLLGAALTW